MALGSRRLLSAIIFGVSSPFRTRTYRSAGHVRERKKWRDGEGVQDDNGIRCALPRGIKAPLMKFGEMLTFASGEPRDLFAAEIWASLIERAFSDARGILPRVCSGFEKLRTIN